MKRILSKYFPSFEHLFFFNHRGAEYAEVFIGICGSDFSRELQFIIFTNILFRLDGELLFFQQRKKSNQKNAAPTSLPFGSPRPSALPTGRPDSPSGLDRTKFDVPVEFSLPKPKASANFTGTLSIPVKLAEDSFTGRVD